MQGTGRKNAARSWLRWEMLRRDFSVSMLAMATIGLGIGFTFRGLPVLAAPKRTLGSRIADRLFTIPFASGAIGGCESRPAFPRRHRLRC